MAPIVIVAIGLAMLVVAVLDHRKTREGLRWPAAAGKVLSSSVEITRGRRGGKSYWPKVHYEYQVNGARYTSDCRRFGESSSWGQDRAHKIVAQYPVGRSVAVFFDPEDPAHAILEPGKTNWFLSLIGAFCVYFGVMLWFSR